MGKSMFPGIVPIVKKRLIEDIDPSRKTDPSYQALTDGTFSDIKENPDAQIPIHYGSDDDTESAEDAP